MVDFNNETTVGIPAGDIVRVLILQRRNDLIESLEHYRKEKYVGGFSDLSIVRARLLSLFIEIQGMLKRRLKEEIYNKLKLEVFTSIKEDDLFRMVFEINETLDSIHLTKIDNKVVYDRKRVEIENKEKI